MSMVQYGWKQALLSQVSIIVFSLAAAFFRHYYGYIILLFFIVYFVAMAKLNKSKAGKGKVPVEEMQASKKFIEEKNARDIMMEDKELSKDMAEQMNAMKIMMIPSLIVMVYFFLLWKYVPTIGDYLTPYVNSHPIAYFLAFLLYFEGSFAITWGSRIYMLRKTGHIVSYNMPTSYRVTEKGILVGGLLGQQPIPFPLEDDVELNLNEKRKFVEIIQTKDRNIIKIRLYTKQPRRLYDILVRYGLKGRKPGDKKQEEK
ncbi:MAG: DUF2208 domain-containing protein [Desulfurococcales archaeon]|nr:DUF2208 domain-containing protein [Desulfurococcales archaeon]MEB3772887.1 DUF2208 domain-containing protein [Desulfurococcales archaeon]MEB3845806.1 DUF2208 domain-containing protein [Desulfurococcales archaeon]